MTLSALPAAAGLVLIASLCAAAAAPGASDYEAAIARLENPDPQAPQALNARLQYADFLAGDTSGDCHARLDAAQAQLDVVAARPATAILLPQGPAKLAGIAYTIHAARADCDPASRSGELHKALDAARDAARLYRDALDYQSAAIMQFNVAATLHALGDSQAAVTALQTAIAMDAAFGYRTDAQDNIGLLQHWRGGEESETAIAQLAAAIPAPASARFAFAWAERDGQMDIDATETNLTGGQVVQSKGAIALKRHVRKNGLNWAVRYDTDTRASIDMGHWPAQGDPLLKRFTSYLLAIALLETPDYTVTAAGDYDDVRGAQAFSKALAAEVTAAFGAPSPDDAKSLSKLLDRNLQTVVLPLYLGTNTAEEHALRTATWAGATLQQGTWYEMTAPLFLPGLGLGQYFSVTHTIAFSYARAVPCAPDDAAKSCAEIVIHATPVPGDMAKAHTQMSSLFHMPDFEALHYWSSIDMRLVVRPATLEPVLSDMRKSWYVAVAGTPPGDTVVSAERVVTRWH